MAAFVRTRNYIHAYHARKNAARPWAIVSDAPPDFAVIRRRTNTFVGLAQFRSRIGASVMDHLMMTVWHSSSRKYPREARRETGERGGETEVEEIGYGQALMFLGISFYCVRAIKRKKRHGVPRLARMTAGLWNSSVQEITLKRLFTGRRCAIFVCKSAKGARAYRWRRWIQTIAITVGISLGLTNFSNVDDTNPWINCTAR